MKRSKARLRRIGMTLALSSALVAAGCTSGGAGKDGAAGETKEGEAAVQTVKVYMSGGAKFPEGEDYNHNPWIEMVKKETGVKLEIEAGPAETNEFMNKLSLKFASDDLPDLFVIPSSSQTWLMENAKLGAIMALDGKLDKYPNLKNAVYPEAWDAVRYEGKTYAIPVLNDGNTGTDNVYIRKDWLDKLNLPIPKTLDDFVEVARAFRDRDPDGNGKADTYGMIAYDTMLGWSHLFGAFGVIPGFWIEKDGKIVQSDIQPEMKEALAFIRKLHEEKLLDNEWPVTKKAAYNEKVATGKAGLYEGNWAATRSELLTSAKNDPKAEWIAIAPPVGPGGKQGVFGDPRYKTFAVISSKAKNVDAILRLLDWEAVPENRDKFVFGFGQYGEGFMYTKENGKLKLNFENHNKYGYRQQFMFMQPKELNDRKMESLGAEFKLVEYINNSVRYGIRNAFTGAPTPSMIEYGSSLDKLRDETFTKIVVGESPLDAFDEFVKTYKAKGGDKIIQDVENWAKTKSST